MQMKLSKSINYTPISKTLGSANVYKIHDTIDYFYGPLTY